MRVLTLLYVKKRPCTIDVITTNDLFITYGKNYGFLDSNLNGDNSYNFSEIASRRMLINEALKKLVLNGLINANEESRGFTYEINDNGIKICKKMHGDYYEKYLNYALKINEITQNFTDKQLINYATKESIRGGE